MPHKRSRKRLWWGIGGGIVALLVLLVVINLSSALRLVKAAQAGRDQILEAQRYLVDEQDFAHASEQLRFAEASLTDAHDRLGELGSWKLIPVLGKQLRATENIVDAGIVFAQGVREMSDIAEQVVVPLTTSGSTSLDGLASEQKREILKTMSESTDDLKRIQSDIQLAERYVDAIPTTGLLGPVKSAASPLKENVPTIVNAIDQLVFASQVIPQIVGYPDPQTYLFLLQNNTELRPTGGFIGTYGILTLKDGEIDTFSTDNIYNLDNRVKDSLFIDPPEPLRKYLSSSQWFMRDSNWSPDFPTAAQEALSFYAQEGGSASPHGVISVTPTLIESLLGLVGNVTVDGVEFTPDNVVDVLQYQVEVGYYRQGVSDADRKEVIGALADTLMERLLALPQEQWGDAWQVIAKNIEEKHILISMQDDDLQNLVEEENWSGTVRQTDGDYVLVVDANMASLKTDPGVYRTMDYTVAPDGDDLIAHLTIQYENRGAFDWKTTRYRTYTRVYIPQGSELLYSSGVMENDKLHGGRSTEPEVYDELGKTVFAGFIAIEPQETGTLEYRYRLPKTLVETMERNGSYTLLFQKQSGTPNRTINVDITLPSPIGEVTPLDSIIEKRNTGVLLQSFLTVDREFSIERL